MVAQCKLGKLSSNGLKLVKSPKTGKPRESETSYFKIALIDPNDIETKTKALANIKKDLFVSIIG